MRFWLLLLVLVTAIACQAEDERNSRDHYYEWNSASPAHQISDSDRESPARLRLEWIEWRRTHGIARIYHDAMDEELHARVFEESELLVAEHNAVFMKGESTYELGINEFADMTKEEFAKYRMSREAVSARRQFSDSLNVTYDFGETDSSHSRAKRSLPTNVDWRTTGCSTPVKDQAGCGSCYAFGVLGVVEFEMCRKTGMVLDLSEQFVVDCSYGIDRSGMNSGCDGGHEVIVMDYLNVHNAPPEHQYRYISGVTGTHYACRSPNTPGTNKMKYTKISSGNELRLQEAVAALGPAVVSMSGENRDFQMFRGGIYSNSKCPKTVDHVVSAVGYGNGDGIDYWILRNSWGTTSGENGYGKIKRGVNQCGIVSDNSWTIKF